MNYIVVLILIILSACAIILVLKSYICTKSEKYLTAYIKNFKEYEEILISDCTDLSIKVFDIFPDIWSDKNYIAKSSAELRKFFITVGYGVDNFSTDLNELAIIDTNLYEEFIKYFRSLKMTSFEKGEPFRKEDLES